MRQLLFSMLLTVSAHAAEIVEPYQSARQLGMGGVYVFDENDGASFMQNPAYTCFVKGFNWSVVNMNLGVGDVKNYETFQDHPIEGFEDLSHYFGKNFYVNVGGFSSLSLPCFGAAGFYNSIGSFRVNNPAFPTLKTVYLTDYGIKVGAAVPIGPVLSFGLDFKRTTRKGGPRDIGPDSLEELQGDDAVKTLTESFGNEGVGYGFDAGLVAHFDVVPLNPTVSLSWKDVGSTSFTKTNGDDAPERQKDNLVLGGSLETSAFGFGMALGGEYRHITDQNEQFGKKIHLGAELSLLFMDVRAGFYQGYPTYGVGLDFWFFQLDAAYYKVERGAYPGQTPDERGQIGISVDLEFDPNFKLVDSSGKRRKLKQRR